MARPEQLYDVCILGWGARTAVGRTPEATAAAVRGGISRLAEHPYMLDKASEPFIVAMDPQIEELGRLPRVLALTAAVMEQVKPAVQRIGGAVPVYFGIAEDLQPVATAVVAAVRRVLGVETRVATVASGHASGLTALQLAIDDLAARRASACIVAGADSHIDPDLLEHLDATGQLLSASNKFGFPPGEGAGALVVAARSLARSSGLPVLGWVIDVCSATEPAPSGSDGICTGVGLAAAIDGATKRLALPDEPVFRIYCDQNGQRFRAADYAWATQRIRPVFADMSDFVTPADCWGDVGAASGPLLAQLALASGLKGYAPGPRALVYTTSNGSQRAAATFHLSA